MHDLFEKIYRYNLISSRGMIFVVLKRILSKWQLLLISIPVGMASLFGVFYFYLSGLEDGNFPKLAVSFLLFLSIFVTPIAYYSREAIGKEIILRVEREFGKTFESMEKATAYAVVKIFDITTDKFWDYAESLQKARKHYFSLRDPISRINYLKFIYDPDSKARIYTLLLALLAIVAARTFQHETPTTLTDIMEWYFVDFSVTLEYWGAFTIATGILLFSVYAIFIFLGLFTGEFWFRFLLTKYSRSEYAIKQLERVLLELHNIPIEIKKEEYQTTLIYKAHIKNI